MDEYYISYQIDSVKTIYREEFDSLNILPITPSFFASKHLTFSLERYSISMIAPEDDSSTVLLLFHNEEVHPAKNSGMLVNHIPINSGNGTGQFSGQVSAVFLPEFSYHPSHLVNILISNDTIIVQPAFHSFTLNNAFRMDNRFEIPSAATIWELHLENYLKDPVVYMLEWEDSPHLMSDADVVDSGNSLSLNVIKHPKKITLCRLKY